MLMLEAGKCLNHLNGTATFLLIKCGDVDAGDHFVDVFLLIMDKKDLTIAFTKVQRYDQIWVILRVGGTARATETQLLLIVILA